MCGIVGYTGPQDATALLVAGLKRLEYRGYDSAGVAVFDGECLEVRRAAGKIAKLEAALAQSPIDGPLGIAHTRWATHGPPNEKNAHPHLSQDGTIAVVHNGIIENATVLRERLVERGYVFRSDTDTEVLAHLIQEVYDESLEQAVIAALRRIEGTYGIAVISSRDPGKIVAARKGSPLLLGIGDGEYFVASDASAILAHTRQVVYLDDGDVAVVDRDGYHVLDVDAVRMERHVDHIDWDLAEIERGGLCALHAQGDLRAAAVDHQRDARAPDHERRHLEAGRHQHVARGAARDRQRHHHRVRDELALGAHRRDDDRGTVPHSRSRSNTRPSSATRTRSSPTARCAS